MIKVKCRECGYAWSVVDSLAGRRILCSECNSKVRVPPRRSAGANTAPPPAVAVAETLDKLPFWTDLSHMLWGTSSHVNRHLLDDEEVVLEGKVHWAILLPGLIRVAVGVGSAILSVLMMAVLLPVGLGAFLFSWYCTLKGLWSLSLAMAARSTTELVVTNMRVIHKYGFFQVKTDELILAQIEAVSVEEPWLARMFNCGNVIVKGSGGTKKKFEYIERPTDFREAMSAISVRKHAPSNHSSSTV